MLLTEEPIPTSEMNAHIGLDNVVMWIGPHIHFVQYPVRRGELFNQVAVFKSFHYKADSEDWGTPEELDEHYGKCGPTLQKAVTYMGRKRRWTMYDREPIDNWMHGNFVLMGDAAHPMLQYYAQGGCQALEDAGCLAEKIKTYGDDTQKAFKEYQQERIPHTARVQRGAHMGRHYPRRE